MEELLQLHIVIPEEVPEGVDYNPDDSFDDVFDLIIENFPAPNEDVPTYDHLGMTVSSSLFERRSDNMEQVDEIETQLKKWYPNESVFRSSYEQTFGENRSAADPNSHIMLLVTNLGVEQPKIRWKQQRKTLQAPPLVLGDEVIHANRDGVFSIDATSGDIRWKREIDHVIQVPVGNENQIIVNTGSELIALDRATGDVQWRTEFDISEEEIIDSRVAVGPENAYVGLRTGEIVTISLVTGDREVLCEYDSPVVGLRMIEPGLIATVSGDGVYLVDSTEKTEWPEDVDVAPSTLYSHGGNLYASAEGTLVALTEEDGTVKWQVDLPVVKSLVQTGDTLVASTDDGLVAVNTETGSRVWDYNEEGHLVSISNPVVVDGVVACVSSSNMSDGEIYICERNVLHIIDPTDGTELRTFELGVGDCYGLSAMDDAITCSVGGELTCLENFPDSV